MAQNRIELSPDDALRLLKQYVPGWAEASAPAPERAAVIDITAFARARGLTATAAPPPEPRAPARFSIAAATGPMPESPPEAGSTRPSSESAGRLPATWSGASSDGRLRWNAREKDAALLVEAQTSHPELEGAALRVLVNGTVLAGGDLDRFRLDRSPAGTLNASARIEIGQLRGAPDAERWLLTVEPTEPSP